ncbi:unnamed protein product [Prorocentrum cordatum]|uniref:Granule-bound starch synthase 1, chloroplastic/amyloplastic n=1 Tax=Prorocentrum cordatum TaxID=2364126 RepID=A0ABN9V1B6_9DINO|nr:unnamed protein product [Polarella glacialis]
MFTRKSAPKAPKAEEAPSMTPLPRGDQPKAAPATPEAVLKPADPAPQPLHPKPPPAKGKTELEAPARPVASLSEKPAPSAVEPKKGHPDTPGGPTSSHDPAAVPQGGKAASLVSGGAAASGAATAAAPAKASGPVARTAAAAVVTEGQSQVTSQERMVATGSVMAKGAGAQAEVPKAPPAAKAKAKAAAAPSATSAPPASAAASAAAPPSSAAAASAPKSVLQMVTGKPEPALVSGTGYPKVQPSAVSESTGPARAYAKSAAAAIAAVPKSAEVPKEGPAAVAVGRALAAGASGVNTSGKKPSVPVSKKYQIVFVTSEVAPFSKTGGLGEAMDGLPTALAALGHRCMVISPRYDQYKEAWDTSFWSSVTMGGAQEPVHFFHTFKQKVDYVFVDHPTFLERVNGMSGSKLYGPEWGKDFADNQSRFAYFCKSALVAMRELPLAGYPYGEDVVVVANDWHSSLVPMFIDVEKRKDATAWVNTKSFFLCHNAVFQGRFELEPGLAEVFGVPQEYIDSITFQMPLKVGKYNKKVKLVNTMAAGILYCDRALTVSPSYAAECAVDPEKGVELERLFAMAKVTGILNGVKEGVSSEDKNFVTKTKMCCGTFTAATVDVAKAQLKAAYQQENGLGASSGPMMCFIGRLDAQKGYDLLLESLIEVLEDTEMQVVIVGAGRADLVQQTKAVEKKFPKKFFYAGWMGPERYALLAGCEYTLLPSRWEPCGLVQMEAMRMGTLPIVAPTGGLKDTVEDGVNGLWTDAEMTVEAELDDASSESISKAIRRACEIHTSTPEKEVEMMRAAMAASAEFTWSNAAMQYEALFDEVGAVDILGAAKDKTVTLETDKQVC